MKTKKLMVFVCTSVLCISLIPVPVSAEPDYSDTEYWTEKCSGASSMSEEDQKACRAFIQYAASRSQSLSQKLTEITAKRDEITADIDDYQAVIDDYQKQSDDLTSQASDLRDQIEDLEKKISEGEEKEKELLEKVKLQASSQQSSMRLNKFVDILMGARSFTGFLRILSGISDIVTYNDKLIEEYKDTVASLKADRESLVSSQTDLQAKQEDIIADQYSAQLVQNKYKSERGELEQEIANVTLAQGAAVETAADVQNALDTALAAMRAAEEAARQKAAAEEAARQKAAAEEAARQKAAAEEAARQAEEARRKAQEQNSGGGEAPVPTPAPTVEPLPQPSVDPVVIPDNNADLRESIVETAMNFLGYPYVYGAAGPDSFDCSGFTQYVYGQYGIYLSHYSGDQENAGTGISESEALPGDLITWHEHTAIYVGRDSSGAPICINALNPGYGVCVLRVADIIVPGGGLQYRRLF